ncbi:hypothetical protein K432DRAFT_298069 [Lepidopterella palustris CBS 459.81]|uniref:Uncharacterized protein n=1 Tax=Lepidopterella palustris CBS 459.81 TaxID=1314670 RepID=A0A8E2JF68_9PEZI|nr:hypothetical protein K432DRAFT_298069 [Lepidopterella palustris CBS 459.81]
MSDALCGPSNALQNFQKHTSVDRTLQQDRLTSRQSPTQVPKFSRIPRIPPNGILDPEFDAFQAGLAGPPQPDFHHLSPRFSHTLPAPQFVSPPQAGGWATDFQRLHITSPQPSVSQHNQHQPQWHADFLRDQGISQLQNTNVAASQPFQSQNQNIFGVMSGYGMGSFAGQAFNHSHSRPAMYNGETLTPQGKQRVQEEMGRFDESAFERAFEQAQAEILREEEAMLPKEALSMKRHLTSSIPQESDPILARIAEKRMPVYLTLKMRSLLDMGSASEASLYLSELEELESDGQLFQDVVEARWCLDRLRYMINGTTQELETRSTALFERINARLMSMYPLGQSEIASPSDIWADLEAAGYNIDRPAQEYIHTEPQQEERQEKNQKKLPRSDADEMAQTAGRLLESVANNTSEKFQKSTFLELMRRLRDREVQVEGNKMVEVSSKILLNNRHLHPPAQADFITCQVFGCPPNESFADA